MYEHYDISRNLKKLKHYNKKALKYTTATTDQRRMVKKW